MSKKESKTPKIKPIDEENIVLRDMSLEQKRLIAELQQDQNITINTKVVWQVLYQYLPSKKYIAELEEKIKRMEGDYEMLENEHSHFKGLVAGYFEHVRREKSMAEELEGIAKKKAKPAGRKMDSGLSSIL